MGCFLILPLLGAGFGVLWYLGMAVSKTVLVSVGYFWAFPLRWEGRFRVLTGTMARGFVVFSGYRCLVLEVGGEAGELEVEVKDKEGVFYVWRGSGEYFDKIEIGGRKRITCKVRGEGFRGRILVGMR